ncbi:hypothetical protein PENVUL_c059G04710 [Penicillium vulpinum]|uniref:LysM domain-containing protein n=1 Tax=Penicillium vulpinum TaxID=29845 RepID=A0A1V6RE63_9EURO|nr:hypothetical protein PENVUL_c059G04710 [Penicillium vulpinum]
MTRSSSRLAGLLALSLALCGVEARPPTLKAASPNLPSDPSTISTCTWWWDNDDGAIACEDMPFEWGISMEDFLLWNPSITADCGNYLTGRSYCVEAPAGGTGPSPTTTATTTTGPAPTSGNGIETPLPTRPGMADNCNAFYYVEVGDSCPSITSVHGITTAQFIEWNPSVGPDCTGLWASYYLCVSVIGHNPVTTTTKTTSTPPGPTNGIETPLPIQPGMVDNCDAFHLVKSGDICDTIAATYKITTTQFATWNSAVGPTCSGLWANTYACVSVIGHTPNPTTTTTTTTKPPPTTTSATGPSPTQSGLTATCVTFYKAQNGDTCEIIARQKFRYIYSLPLFKRWNPAVGENCDNLLPGYYYCVATELHQPMPGIIDTCKGYYQVKDGDSCWSIQQQYGITATEFNRWNPLVGSSCSSLWLRYFVCVGV